MFPKHPGFFSLLVSAALVAGCSSGSSGGNPALTGPQTGSVSVNLATGVVSVPDQAQGIAFSGSAAYDDPTDTVTLSLSIKNTSKTLLQNAKVLFTSVSEGTIIGDGTYATFTPADGGGVPYVYYGPESVLSNGSVTRDITIENVTGAAANLLVDLEVKVHPWIFLPTYWSGIQAVDASGSGQSLNIEGNDIIGTAFRSSGWLSVMPSAVSEDGRYVYFGHINQPAIGRLDMTDLSFTLGESLMDTPLAFDGTGPIGSVEHLTTSPDGNYIYAVLNADAHLYAASGQFPTATVELIKLNAKTMAEVDRVTVYEPVALAGDGGGSSSIRGRPLSISADGTLGALPITEAGLVSLINLTSMTLVDTDSVTPGEQGFDVSATGTGARFAAISPDKLSICVAHQTSDSPDGTLDSIDVATGGIVAMAPDTAAPAGEHRAAFLTYGPDGRLYYGRGNSAVTPGVSIFDPQSDTWTELDSDVDALGIAFSSSAYYLWDEATEQVRAYSLSTDQELSFEATGVPGISLPGAGSGHGLLLTGDV
jgi:hypothetical protein